MALASVATLAAAVAVAQADLLSQKAVSVDMLSGGAGSALPAADLALPVPAPLSAEPAPVAPESPSTTAGPTMTTARKSPPTTAASTTTTTRKSPPTTAASTTTTTAAADPAAHPTRAATPCSKAASPKPPCPPPCPALATADGRPAPCPPPPCPQYDAAGSGAAPACPPPCYSIQPAPASTTVEPVPRPSCPPPCQGPKACPPPCPSAAPSDQSCTPPCSYPGEEGSAAAAFAPCPASGVAGGVSAGPTCPVERPDQPCADKPVETTLRLLRHDGSVAATTRSGPDGSFRLAVAPGSYRVGADWPSRVGGCAPVEVVVEPNRFAHAHVTCDTGIR